MLFDAVTPLLYAWPVDDDADTQVQALRVCGIAEQLFQLGRGVDMAWAWGEILTASEAQARVDEHGGTVFRPCDAGDGIALPVPLKGSLDSLIQRHERARTRFQAIRELRPNGREPNRQIEVGQLLAQPPKPRFRQVAYDSPPRRLLFDLVAPTGQRSSWRLDRIVDLAERVRDAGAQRMKDRLPDGAETIHNSIVGHCGGAEADKAQRVRITPLPSIGHPHADHAIRRVLVEIPTNCPLRADDVEWAFSGLLLVSEHGEILCELAPAADRNMLLHYGLAAAPVFAVWRTVTPAALPAARRRIDPAQRHGHAKAGAERVREEAGAAAAVAQALRHAGVSARPLAVRVQREPFGVKGARSEAFASGPRFTKERLWHVEVTLDTPQRGPVLLGDGRYLGLGLMAPAQIANGVLAFAIEGGLEADPTPQALTRALRRAVLARVQGILGEGKALPLYLTGHEAGGASARSGGTHRHIAFAYDQARRQLLILAPHALEHRSPWSSERMSWSLLEEAMRDFTELRAGASGKLRLERTGADVESSDLFAPAREWESATTYCTVRHRKLANAAMALAADIAEECCRLRLPRVDIKILESHGINGVGLVGRARLRFATAVPGPILLGRDRHFGGGLFAGRPYKE
jgi:CRISPR-associated protein Csb2